MNEKFNYLFQYLKKEKIVFDKSEFLFQIQSHPDYPSLLATSDTLSFFNIENGVLKVFPSEIELLPNYFVAFLNDKEGNSELLFIEKNGNDYYYTQDENKHKLNKLELESLWKNIVLLIVKPEIEEIPIKIKTKFHWILHILFIVLFLINIFQFEDNLQTILFFLFPILGVMFSVAVLKDLFGAKSELLDSFCNMTASTSCSTVVGSSKWKVFEIINFSDLSMVFFGSQFIGFLFFLFSANLNDFFTIQQILLLSSAPILFLSVYYQKFVEKKWCPICLIIICIILLELIYLFVFQKSAINISISSIILFGLVFVSVMISWSALKKILMQQNELKEFQLKGTRFMRNYQIFKNTLVSKEKVQLPQSSIILGNNKSKTHITVITNPFCAPCKDVHKVLKNILRTNKDDLTINLLINTNIDTLDNEKKKFFRTLMAISLNDGAEYFFKALDYWYDSNQNMTEWLNVYNLTFDSEKIDAIYKKQKRWCIDNGFNSTPSLFINGYQYPKTYNRENLLYFINDLIEDEDF